MVSKQANGYVKCPQHGKPLWGRCAKGGVPPQHSQQAAGRLGMSFMTDEDAMALQGCPCPAEAHSWRGPKQSSRVQTYTISSHMASSSARQKDTCKVQDAWASGVLEDLMDLPQKCPAANGLQLLRLEHLDLTIIAAHRK